MNHEPGIVSPPGTDATATRTRTTPLVLAFVAILGVFPLAQDRLNWTALAGASLALTCVSARLRATAALHLGALCTLLLAALSASGSMRFWPIAPLLATVAYLALAKRWMALGGLPSAWFRRGGLDGVFPKLPTYALFGGVVVFAAVNAALEEALYRGVVMGALDASLGAGAGSVVLQAVVFGILHVGGFPRGAIGVGLATIYGLMMGAVRRRAAGMLAPWIAHVGADVTIGSILLFALHR